MDHYASPITDIVGMFSSYKPSWIEIFFSFSILSSLVLSNVSLMIYDNSISIYLYYFLFKNEIFNKLKISNIALNPSPVLNDAKQHIIFKE